MFSKDSSLELAMWTFFCIVGRLVFTFLNFKDFILLSSGLDTLWGEICGDSYLCSIVCNVPFFLQLLLRFFVTVFSNWFTMYFMCTCECMFVFILCGIPWTSWNCAFEVCNKLKFSQPLFFPTLLHLFCFHASVKHMLDCWYCPTGHWVCSFGGGEHLCSPPSPFSNSFILRPPGLLLQWLIYNKSLPMIFYFRYYIFHL